MAEMFSSAAAYEAYMGRWSARLAPLFADFVGLRNGGRVLDVGCGTGSMIQVVAERAPQAELVGVDPVQPFLDHARSRFSDPRVAFDRGSALELPYPDASFDYSLSLLVFQLLPEPAKAAAEMRRVTRPGGTVAACAWDGKGLEMAAVLWEEGARLGLGGEWGGERQCSSQGALAGLWGAAGLARVEEAALEIRTEFRSFDDYWLPLLGGVGPAGAYVAKLTPGQRDALREALRVRLLAGRPDGSFSLGARAWAVRGTVPL